MGWDEQLQEATAAWRAFCRTLEETGAEALAATLTHDEVDLAEGLRHMARMTQLALLGSLENKDATHPYLWPALDPHRKMGGDNPQGLYLSGPINGTDTFRLRGTRGSARWVSIIVGQKGPPPFGDALFLPDLEVADDGTFEVVVAPEPQPGNHLRSTAASTGLLVRQFFSTPDHVEPMELTLENLTGGSGLPRPLALATAVAGLQRATGLFAFMVPMMQGELLGKGSGKNAFATDVGDPTSTSGGVPGGNAVTARWALEPDEALVVRVAPPEPCAYWDVQVGNGWYESFDYRNHFSGLTCEGAHLEPDGSVVLVVADRDPGVANWLEAAGHREGHIAIRWQLSEGDLPIPATHVVNVDEVAAVTGLPPVAVEERARQRALLATSFDGGSASRRGAGPRARRPTRRRGAGGADPARVAGHAGPRRAPGPWRRPSAPPPP